MRTISQTAAAVLDHLTEGLTNPCEADEGSSRKIENSGGTFMAVNVCRLGENLFAVAHYYEQNGDLVPDPMMEFVKVGDSWYPVAIEHCGFRREACELKLNDEGSFEVKAFRPRELKDQCSFVTTWMRNIKGQQKLKVARKKSATKRVTVASMERAAEKRFVAWQDKSARAFIAAKGRTAKNFRELAEWAGCNGHSFLAESTL
jgi:hypothetical protein